jgi:hypothetical protein
MLKRRPSLAKWSPRDIPEHPIAGQRGSRVTPSDPKVAQSEPKAPQGVPKAPKRLPKSKPKSTPRPTRAKIKIDTFSKLGFVHRRSVFEPPKLKVDYPYYVLGTLEILILVKSDETIINTMLLEPLKKPVLAWEREARFNKETLTRIPPNTPRVSPGIP